MSLPFFVQMPAETKDSKLSSRLMELTFFSKLRRRVSILFRDGLLTERFFVMINWF